MTHSESSILKIMSLPSVGRKTAFKLLNELTYSISSYVDLIDFVKENSKLIRNQLSDAEIRKAFDNAENIIERSEKAEIKLIGYSNSEFPTLLKGIDDAPLLLSIKGPYSILNQMPSVAIIGTRAPSDYGYKVGIRLGEVFGEAGFNVISGLAIGCDTAGHTGCLNRGGITTAVLAHGLDTIYPKENKPLAAKILDEGGLLVSEYLIGQRSQPSYFVERDRIQAGMSQAVIVVETDIKGGTMHTVKFAANNKRIVAAFNHDAKYLFHPKTQGNQYLIKNKTARPLSDPASIDALKATLLDLSGYVLPIKPLATTQTPVIHPIVDTKPINNELPINPEKDKIVAATSKKKASSSAKVKAETTVTKKASSSAKVKVETTVTKKDFDGKKTTKPNTGKKTKKAIGQYKLEFS